MRALWLSQLPEYRQVKIVSIPGVVVQQTWVAAFGSDFYPVWKLHTSASSLIQDPIFMARCKHRQTLQRALGPSREELYTSF